MLVPVADDDALNIVVGGEESLFDGGCNEGGIWGRDRSEHARARSPARRTPEMGRPFPGQSSNAQNSASSSSDATCTS